MKRPEFIARQSRRPRGTLGWVIGHIMSWETAPLNDAVLGALDLQPSHRVLEVGFGHGRTLRRAAQKVSEGFVGGVDFSSTMLRMASRRCRPFLNSKRMQLELADSAHLPFPDETFDHAYSVNTLYFWKDPVEHLREIRRVLRPGGWLALGFRTRIEGSGTEAFPDSVYTFRSQETVGELLLANGFDSLTFGDTGALGPGTVVLLAQARPPRNL